jgi:two-component sensor histidine kinase
VSLQRVGSLVVLRVRDNGIGLSSGFSLQRDMSTGLNIASSLAEEDLNGELRLTSDGGTVAEIAFPGSDA